MAENNSYLYIIVDAPSGRRKFKVRIPGAVEDVTGYQLKARVERSAGIPINEQILKYKDRVIGDTDTCGILGIRNGEVLNASGTGGNVIVPFPASPTTSVAPTIMTSPLPSPRRTSSPPHGFGNDSSSIPSYDYQPQSPNNGYTSSGTVLSPTVNLSPPSSYQQPSSATYVNQASSPQSYSFPSTIIHPPNNSTYLSPTSYNQPTSTFSSPSYQPPTVTSATHLSPPQSATYTPVNHVPTSASSTFVPTVVSAYGHDSTPSHRSFNDPMSAAPTYTRNNDIAPPNYNHMSPTYTSPSYSRTMFYGDPGLSNVMVANNPAPRCAQCGDPLHPVHDHRVLPLCQSCQKAHYQLQALSYIQSRSRSLSW